MMKSPLLFISIFLLTSCQSKRNFDEDTHEVGQPSYYYNYDYFKNEKVRKLHNEGLALIQEKMFDLALTKLDSAIAMDSSIPQLFIEKANCLFGLKQYSLALVQTEKAIAIDSNAPIAFINRGQTRYRLELFEEAIKDFNYAIELGMNNCPVYLNRANTYFALGKSYLSCQDYIKAIELGKDDVCEEYAREFATECQNFR